MAPVSGLRFRDHNELTGEGINRIISYWPASQKTRWHDARICLGETQTDTLNRLDLCYSFKVLCQVEYGGTRQLHHAAKNYARNYRLTAGLHQNRCIPYERALRNLVVLMFSHYVNHLECTGSLEGHRTLMVHECLVVAASLGRYHRWQCTEQVTKIGTLTTGPKSRSSRRMTSGTSIVRPLLCWVTHKTRHMLTQNCSDVVSTMFTFAGGSLVICLQGGDHPTPKRGPSSFTTKNTRS